MPDQYTTSDGEDISCSTSNDGDNAEVTCQVQQLQKNSTASNNLWKQYVLDNGFHIFKPARHSTALLPNFMNAQFSICSQESASAVSVKQAACEPIHCNMADVVPELLPASPSILNRSGSLAVLDTGPTIGSTHRAASGPGPSGVSSLPACIENTTAFATIGQEHTKPSSACCASFLHWKQRLGGCLAQAKWSRALSIGF